MSEGAGTVRFDGDRFRRLGLVEAVLAEGKTPEQIAEAVDQARDADGRALITRLRPAQFGALPDRQKDQLDYDAVSRTAMMGVAAAPDAEAGAAVVILTGGSSDVRVAREAARTLQFHGAGSREVADVGVAGLWRILEQRELVETAPVVIVCAGMEGALFSVVGGMARGVVIATPTSNGYGVAANGRVAMLAALSSCAPGLAVTNIDNGYGAACIALRVLAACRDSNSGG